MYMQATWKPHTKHGDLTGCHRALRSSYGRHGRRTWARVRKY